MKSEYFSKFPFAELRSQDGSSVFKLCVYGYQFPEIEKGYDSDWLKTYTYLSIPGFRVEIDEAMFEAMIWGSNINDLQKFSSLVNNTANLTPSESFFNLSFEFNNRKNVDVTGNVEYPLGWGARLEFRFETDLTYIDKFIQGLRSIFYSISFAL